MKSSIPQAKPQSNWARTSILGAALLFAALQASAATPTYYWDTNGSDDGPGNPPDGVWAWDTPTWTLAPDGTGDTFYYSNRANIVFAANTGSDWSGTLDYTVTIDGLAHVSDIVIQDGNCTLTNAFGYLDKDTPYISVLNPGQTGTIYSTIASAPGTANGITKCAFGTLVLGGTNTYQGTTTIEGGTLRLGAPQVLPRTSTLVLAGGDTRTTGYTHGYSSTDPTFDTGGYSQTLGPLLLTGPYAGLVHTIDFGNGASALVFADSHTQNWSGITNHIVNYKWGVDSLRFGTSSAGLTSTQVGLIEFELINAQDASVAVPAKIDSSGFVTPALPVLLSVTLNNSTNTVVTWSAINGRRYLLHYKLNLNDASWLDVPRDVTATGNTAAYTNNVGSDRHRFYRVELLPITPPS
jgi:autotransporter-associated beta strand protein